MAKADKAEMADKKARIKACRDHFKAAVEADEENRRGFVEDMKFVHVPGEQWQQIYKDERGDDRLTLQFNRMRITIKSIINQMRQNPGSVKVRGVEEGDKDVADINAGIIRNILNSSNWDSIRDNVAEYQVAGGYGAWRITTDYSDDTVFEQDIKIEGLRNPLCLHCDPTAYDITGADANWWVYTDKISKAAFKQRYPKAEPVNFEDTEFDDDEDWEGEGENGKVRIAEHWWKKPVTKNIHLLDDGKTIDDSELPDAQLLGRQVLKSREVQCYEIWSAIYSRDAELTPPTKWAGKYFPWIRVYGEYVVIEGKAIWYGHTRHGKDPQRAHNHALTAATEAVMTAPVNQNQVWATAKQAQGLVGSWIDAVKRNLPFQIYNHDPQQPGPPQRQPPAAVPVAQMQFSQVMGEELKANLGIFDASLGSEGNEKSGRAIIARDQQGQVATWNYRANLANAERRMDVILVDLIPRIYDTARSMRILGADDSDKYVKVNQPGPKGQVINDLTVGKYDVVFTPGPSFATKRMEAAEVLTQMAQSDPTLMPIAGDLVMKAMDVPYADEIAERKRMMLPPQIQQQLNQDKPLPPEVQQAQAAMEQKAQEMQQFAMALEKAALEAQGEVAKADKSKAEIQIQVAKLQTEMAKLDTQKAQFEVLVTKAKAEVQEMLNQQAMETERASLADEANRAAETIIQAATSAIQEIDSRQEGVSRLIDGLIALEMNPTSGGSPMQS